MAENNPTPNPNETQPTPQGNPAPAFDYDKLASLINGKQSVAEDTVLKSYFKEQGLSADEMKQAIGAFKEQKAKNTPDVAKLMAEVNQSATLEAVKQGVDVASIPYVLKMADFSAVSTDGEINTEKLTEAVKKVLDDIPALKTKASENAGGVQKIGGDGNGTSDGTKPNSSVPTKKWNRFNI